MSTTGGAVGVVGQRAALVLAEVEGSEPAPHPLPEYMLTLGVSPLGGRSMKLI